jgi:hypothetical protein
VAAVHAVKITVAHLVPVVRLAVVAVMCFRVQAALVARAHTVRMAARVALVVARALLAIQALWVLALAVVADGVLQVALATTEMRAALQRQLAARAATAHPVPDTP